MSDITKQSLSELVKNIKNKKISSMEVTKAFIDRSEKSKELNTYITEDFSNALDKAKKFDDKGVFGIGSDEMTREEYKEYLREKNFSIHD